jgi:hypothetical protein
VPSSTGADQIRLRTELDAPAWLPSRESRARGDPDCGGIEECRVEGVGSHRAIDNGGARGFEHVEDEHRVLALDRVELVDHGVDGLPNRDEVQIEVGRVIRVVAGAPALAIGVTLFVGCIVS